MTRDRAGVQLTPEGRVFLQYAEQSSNALRQGLSSLSVLGKVGGAVLKIGALPSVTAQILPVATLAFRAMSPRPTTRSSSPRACASDGPPAPGRAGSCGRAAG